MNERKRMEELVQLLRRASQAYYQEDRELMSNLEYDRLYDELIELEKSTGTVLAGSPTVTVGYEAVEELPKEAHETPMLSLDKTKDVEVLRSFLGDQEALLSWKLDGLTVVLTYGQGELKKAVTRGNGVIGEVITNNARVFKNIPLRIPYQGNLVLRGEAIITYSDFQRINQEIPDGETRYKNPRNLCSGSVRQLNNQVTAARSVRFFAFGLVSAPGVDFRNSRACQMEWLRSQGFEVVYYRMVNAGNLDEAMDYFSREIQHNDFPSDGLVALYDDIAYGESLGSTAKFPRNSFAFKWADEIQNTHLREVEWSPSRTGLINPVAIFDPVELEGTTVSRASLHNISIMRGLQLGIGDEIQVYKANMIIPQIAENLTRSNKLPIADICPACQEKTEIRRVNDVESLYCTNPSCPAKAIKAYTLFVSRDAMNIDGLSEMTLEKFIGHGLIHSLADIFRIQEHREAIVNLEGFGEKSFQNLAESVERARRTTLPRLLYGLGIPNVGLAGAKLICRAFEGDLERIRQAEPEEFSSIDGIGPVIAGSIAEYFRDPKKARDLDELLLFLDIQQEKVQEGKRDLEGMVFVITGSVEHFANRKELKEHIESRGGKVTGSVTSKTTYLINNDAASGSSKNKKAKELGISILTEEQFLNL